MGTLLSILGSIGIISNGASAVTSTTNYVAIKDSAIKSLLNGFETSLQNGWYEFSEVTLSLLEKYVYIPEGLETSDIIPYLEEIGYVVSSEVLTVEETLAAEAAVEGGILAGSLGTAAETLGISLAIGAAIYGGYYTYQHWDSVKQSASETLKTTESYIASTTNYLKSWWPF
uniref:Putative transmembrane protein n=1 Tax=Spiroplasma citri TaxID=2133 RepID=Q3ZVH4_SPICI|nr:putative transmembrane protein [Spiroplasma citri]